MLAKAVLTEDYAEAHALASGAGWYSRCQKLAGAINDDDWDSAIALADEMFEGRSL